MPIRIPFIVKLNHNELLTYPNPSDEIMFANVEQAWNLGAVAVGADDIFLVQKNHRVRYRKLARLLLKHMNRYGDYSLVLPPQQRF